MKAPIYKVCLVREGEVSSEAITTSQQAKEMGNSLLQGTDREHFLVFMLDGKNKIIGVNTVSVGSLTCSIVHPREVFKPAILSNADAVIFIHNHPSGDPNPSADDIEITSRLVQAGEILGIRVLDHIILGQNRSESMQALGYIR